MSKELNGKSTPMRKVHHSKDYIYVGYLEAFLLISLIV